jgi:hypothetical protein
MIGSGNLPRIRLGRALAPSSKGMRSTPDRGGCDQESSSQRNGHDHVKERKMPQIMIEKVKDGDLKTQPIFAQIERRLEDVRPVRSNCSSRVAANPAEKSRTGSMRSVKYSAGHHWKHKRTTANSNFRYPWTTSMSARLPFS